MKNILIIGGTGMVGKKLTEMLVQNNFRVSHLSRQQPLQGNVNRYQWDLEKKYIQKEAFEACDIIINLAGANVTEKKWTKKRKETLRKSRIESTQFIIDYLSTIQHQVQTVIAASAPGYFGYDRGDELLIETSSPGTEFLAQLTQNWEQTNKGFHKLGIRTVILRFGIVLSHEGGVVEEAGRIIKLGAGAPVGTGKQLLPWIHIKDLCGIIQAAIENEKWTGIYHAVAPEHVSNEFFMKTLASKMGKPLILPNVPALILKLLYGEMAKALLGGLKLSSKKIEDVGFKHEFPNLKSAIDDLL